MQKQYSMLKSSLLFKRNTNLVNNLRIPRTKNAKFSEYYYLSTDIYKDFQIYISVALKRDSCRYLEKVMILA